MRAILLASAVFMAAQMPQAALAKQWSFAADPDGRTAVAYYRPQALNQISFFCSLPGYNPQAWGKLYGDNHPLPKTAPGTYTLEIGLNDLPTTRAEAAKEIQNWRANVMFVVDGRQIQVPPLEYHIIFESLFVDIPAQHPLFEALGSGNKAVVWVQNNGDQMGIPLSGSGRSLGQLASACP
ncbi:MAG: hypothetical protein AB8B85_12270 [Paracoccaceae bacterium]